jgi:hypothetical protein
MVVGDPSDPNFKVQNVSATVEQTQRMQQRVELLGRIEPKAPAALDRSQEDALDHFKQRAMPLLTSDATRRAFDLSHEPRALRERYGMHRFE